MWLKSLIFILLLPYLGYSATQVKIVGTGVNDASVGDIAITVPGNCTADDNVFTGGVGGDQIQDAETHQRLKATMTGNLFTIPLSATIDSIKGEYSMLDARNKDEGLDLEVKLLKAGVVSGNDQSKTATVPGTETVRVYAPVDTVGGDDKAGTWGVALTPADVNDPDFGVTYRGKVVGASGRYQLKIDFIRITVSYTAAVPATATETIKPEAIADQDTWDSTGSGATKTIRITDGVDANYVRQLTATNLDRYSMTNLKSNDDGVESYDSIRVYATMQDSGAGTNQLSIDHIVGGTVVSGSVRTLTTSWVEYINGYTTKPGGGSWTKAAIDSLVIQLEPNAIAAGQQVRLSECSVVVFMTLENHNDLFFTNDNGCKSGSDFGKDMTTLKPKSLDTLKVVVAGGATRNDFVTAPIAYAVTWNTGGFSVILNVVKQVNPCSLKIRINAVAESNCATIAESTPFSTQKTISGTGEDTTVFSSIDWTSAVEGTHTVQVQLQFLNAIGQSEDTLWIEVGVNETVFEHELLIVRPAVEDTSNCTGTLKVLKPTASGTPTAWTSANADTKWDNVQDGIDDSNGTVGNYDSSATSGQSERFALANSTGMPADAIIDTIFIITRATRFGADRARIIPRFRMTGNANFCDASRIQPEATGTWQNFSDFIVGYPSAGGNCLTAFVDPFNSARVDSLEVQINNKTGLPSVTQVELIICFHQPAAGGQVIRIQLGRVDDPLELDAEQIWAVTKDSKREISDCGSSQ